MKTADMREFNDLERRAPAVSAYAARVKFTQRKAAGFDLARDYARDQSRITKKTSTPNISSAHANAAD